MSYESWWPEYQQITRWSPNYWHHRTNAEALRRYQEAALKATFNGMRVETTDNGDGTYSHTAEWEQQ